MNLFHVPRSEEKYFQMKSRVSTSHSITDIIIGCIENESLADKCKLPTNRSVMARYLHMRTENALKPNNDLISLLFGEMEIVRAKSGIPIKQKKHVTKQLTSLLDEYRNLKKEGTWYIWYIGISGQFQTNALQKRELTAKEN